MGVRRVVTGHSSVGKAIVSRDDVVEPVELDLLAGYEFFRLWGADESPTVPDAADDRSSGAYFPPAGGFRFGLFTVPPETTLLPGDIDIEGALISMEAALPGMAAHMEPDHPGMHTTDTVDFEYVIEGEVVLELDDGVEVALRAGDTVVQRGTRHAWRNRSDAPCRMVVVLVGAERAG